MSTAERVIKILQKKYPQKFRREDPFEVLVHVLLSARTKDTTTFPAQARLLKQAPNAADILKLSTSEIQKLIYPVGFYRQKAKHLKKMSKMLLTKFGGRVPNTKEELMELPGIGPKSASIVLAYGFGVPAIAVDTHVNRISQRLGWVPKNSKPEKTQPVIEHLVPQKYHLAANHVLVSFGKDICRPIAPHCFRCPIYDFCKYDKKQYYKQRQVSMRKA